MQGQPQKRSEPRFWCKVFQTKHDIVGAICDKKLLKKTLKDEKMGVKVKISEHFYGGIEVGENVALKIMRKVTIGNVIGEEIVDLAIKNGFITKENTILIDGVPHAQFVKV